AAIPVLHLSASFIESDSRSEGLESGADGYLTYPVEPRELIANVQALLRIRLAEAERQRADEARLGSEERLRRMVESVRDYALFSTDPEGRIASWNTGAEGGFGYPEAEGLGRAYLILFTPEDGGAGAAGRRR